MARFKRLTDAEALTTYERLAPGQGTIAGKVVSVLHRIE